MAVFTKYEQRQCGRTCRHCCLLCRFSETPFRTQRIDNGAVVEMPGICWHGTIICDGQPIGNIEVDEECENWESKEIHE